VSTLWLFNTKGNGAALSATEGNDQLAAVAGVAVGTSASITEADDSVAAVAVAIVSTSASISEADDAVTSSSLASVFLLLPTTSVNADVLVSASAAITEADDAVGATAAVSVSVSASIIEDADNSAAIGTLTAVIAGGYISASRPRKRPRIESGRRPTQDEPGVYANSKGKSAEQVKKEIAYDNDFLLMVG
jgi:hypothetical protein